MDLSVTDLQHRADEHELDQLHLLVLQVRLLEAVSLLTDNARRQEAMDGIAFLHDKLSYFDAAESLIKDLGGRDG